MGFVFAVESVTGISRRGTAVIGQVPHDRVRSSAHRQGRLVTGGETLHPLRPRQTARAVAACEGFIAAYRSATEFSA